MRTAFKGQCYTRQPRQFDPAPQNDTGYCLEGKSWYMDKLLDKCSEKSSSSATAGRHSISCILRSEVSNELSRRTNVTSGQRQDRQSQPQNPQRNAARPGDTANAAGACGLAGSEEPQMKWSTRPVNHKAGGHKTPSSLESLAGTLECELPLKHTIDVPAGCALRCLLAAMTAPNQHCTLPSWEGQGAMVLVIRLCSIQEVAALFGGCNVVDPVHVPAWMF